MTYTKSVLYRLLYDALIELRARGHERSDKVVFLLADLFHNVPLQLDRLDRGETTVHDIKRELEERAQRNGIEGWLDLRTSEIEKYHPKTMLGGDTPQ